MNADTTAASERGKAVFEEEAEALRCTGSRLDASFDRAIETLLASTGRVVLTGMGKHGIIARKIAATFASTGTHSFFMHPAEGMHGDLGMIEPSDVIIAVSNSGNTGELLGCVPFFKRNRNFLIAMTGKPESELARHADLILNTGVAREVCPLNLAPTTSTTVALAMGDALAVVLLERRGFKPDDFALRHPGGALGKRLLLRVSDRMRAGINPVVSESDSFGKAIEVATHYKMGAVTIVNPQGNLAGIVTDGDMRRIWQSAGSRTVNDVLGRPVSEVMTRNPVSVTTETLAAKAISIMEDGPRKILVLPVVDDDGKPVGMLHLHDLVSAGI